MSTTAYKVKFLGEEYEIECFDSDFITGRVRNTGRPYEFDELSVLADFFATQAKPAGLMLDIGANIGNHALALSRVGFEEVICVEMVKGVYEVLCRNLERSCKCKWSALNAAMSAPQSGNYKIAVQQYNVGGASLVPVTDWRLETSDLDAPMICIDEMKGLERLRLVKIDVEGHERFVLKGGMETLVERKPLIMVEIFADKWDASAAVLKSIGYSKFVRLHGVPGGNFLFDHDDNGFARLGFIHRAVGMRKLIASRIARCHG